MKVRVIYKPDKSVAIIYPAPNSRRLDETENQWLERIFTKATQEELPFDDIDSSELPQKGEAGDVWEGEKGRGVWVNLEKTAAEKEKVELEEQIHAKLREIALKELGVLKKN